MTHSGSNDGSKSAESACSAALQRAALEYELATGFEPLNYNQSDRGSFSGRREALIRDLKWFEDHADEAQQRVWAKMKDLGD